MNHTEPAHIAWIGCGVMGAPMAGHLLATGVALRVHSRTRARAEPLLERGATWAASPAEAAAGAAIVFSIVGLPEDVHQVHLGPAGTLSATPPPALVVDMTTSRPSLARQIHAAAAERSAGAVDAPVSGGDVGAVNATLSIMAGGETGHVEHVRPWLQRLGRIIVHQGGPGAGQHTKMVNQILIAGTMMGLCEGLVYARRAGLDPQRVIESVGSGAAGSWSVTNLAPRVARGDFEPGFAVEHFIKDLSIALEEAAAMGLALPGLALARQLYHAARANGFGRKGTHVLYRVVEALSGMGAAPASPPPTAPGL